MAVRRSEEWRDIRRRGETEIRNRHETSKIESTPVELKMKKIFVQRRYFTRGRYKKNYLE